MQGLMSYSDVYKTGLVPRDTKPIGAFHLRNKANVHERPALVEDITPDEKYPEMSASFKILAAMAGLVVISVVGCIVMGVVLYKHGYGAPDLREVNGTAYAYGLGAQIGSCPPCNLGDMVWSVQCPPCGSQMEGCPACKPWIEKIVCPKCDTDKKSQCEPCTEKMVDCSSCDDSNKCTSPQCLRDSAKIKEAMDETVNPCDNFFEFACGNWLKANPAPHGVDKWETTMLLEMTTMDRARKVLESPVQRMNASSAERKMKDFDASCTAGKLSEREEKAGLKRIVHRIGGWAGHPEHISLADSGFDGDSWNLQQALKVMTFDLKADILFQPFLNYDERKSTVQLELMAINHDCSKSKDERRYLHRLAEIIFGRSNSDRFVEGIIETRAELCKATAKVDRVGLMNITIQELHNLFSDISTINWLDLLRYRYKSLNESSKILIFGFEQMRAMAKAMDVINRRDLRDFFTHISIREHMNMMLPQIQDAYYDYNPDYITKQDPSTDECVQELARTMPFALLAELDKDLDPDGKHSVISDDKLYALQENIRETIFHQMGKVAWLNEDIKRRFKRKIKKAKIILGAPKWIKDDQRLDKFYSELDINRSATYLENYINMVNFKDTLLADEYDKNGIDELYWRLFVRQPRVFAANAHNYVAKGSLAIYPSMLLPPFYSPDSPLYMNYGGLGYILAHEFGHFFDGINSDAWINMTQIKSFDKRAKCLRDYFASMTYNNYSYPNNTNAMRHAQQQGIADISGLKWAFEAYKYVTRDRQEAPLVGLSYTAEQLFFISAAQVWCVKQINPDMSYEANARGIRLLGMIGQSKHAGEAFQCPRGTTTQPEEDCGFW